jgi:hypothetical protein
MDESRSFEAQAARCRRLAFGINDWPVKTMLLRMAEDFEAKAREEAEHPAPPSPDAQEEGDRR